MCCLQTGQIIAVWRLPLDEIKDLLDKVVSLVWMILLFQKRVKDIEGFKKEKRKKNERWLSYNLCVLTANTWIQAAFQKLSCSFLPVLCAQTDWGDSILPACSWGLIRGPVAWRRGDIPSLSKLGSFPHTEDWCHGLLSKVPTIGKVSGCVAIPHLQSQASSCSHSQLK